MLFALLVVPSGGVGRSDPTHSIFADLFAVTFWPDKPYLSTSTVLPDHDVPNDHLSGRNEAALT